MKINYLIEKEFKQFLRNPFLPRFIFVFPFVMLGLLPLAANFEVKDVKISIIDNSRSPLSNRLIHKMESSGFFKISDVSNNPEHSLREIEQDNSDVIVEIPVSFEKDLIREQKTDVMISANTVDAVKGALSSAYLVGLLAEFNDEIRAELLPQTSTKGFEVTKLFRYNPRLKYTYAMVPAIMVMLISMICGFLPAFNIVMEKEQGTIEQMNVTPVNKFSLILSKLIPYWVAGFIILNICFLVARLFYGMWPQGSILTIYLFETVYVLAMSGFGLVVSNYSKTLQQSMFIVFFFVITFIFLGGLYTPVDNMPGWAKTLSDLDPIKYFIEVMRLIYLKGSSVSEMLPLFFSISAFAVLFNVWAVISYKKKS
jgi:ABC-2 type transport system permease protein